MLYTNVKNLFISDTIQQLIHGKLIQTGSTPMVRRVYASVPSIYSKITELAYVLVHQRKKQ